MASQQGWNQQTPAVRSLLSSAMGVVRRATTKRKRRSKSASAPANGAKRSRKRSVKRTAAKLVKGSAKAKQFMAKLRALRKK